jgi:hypothetical protein
MSDDPLGTYLQDHLAGAAAALELVDGLRAEHSDDPLGALAAKLLADIGSDRDVLDALAQRVDGSSLLKDATGWLGTKLGRFKLGRAAGALGTFQALETLALGILGKLALWHALKAIAPGDARVSGVDFDVLAERALAQHSLVEAERLRLARAALRSAGA